MKVAQFLYSGLGGHGSVAFSLLDADKNHAWQPLLGFLGIEPLLPAYDDACKVRGIQFEYFAATAGQPWKTWPSIARWLKTCSPDVIILHGMSAFPPSYLHARRVGVPLVIVEHQANALKRRSEWFLSCLAMLLADQVVVLTPGYKVELKRSLGVAFQSRKVRVLPNGIDTIRFAPYANPRPSRAQTVRLGMAARFTGNKRHDVLVIMMTVLLRCQPKIDWQLSLAGDGESLVGIHELVNHFGLQGSVSLPGQLDESALIKWYSSLDIYVHASDGETLSTALLQAMAMKLPIVASDVSGIKDLIAGERICGLLVKSQDPQFFAEAVLALVGDSLLSTELGKTGRQVVELFYSQTRMFDGYAQMLKKYETPSASQN